MAIDPARGQDPSSKFAGEHNPARGLALVRITIGAMFVWVFFENLGKGTYTAAGYAGVIDYYIKMSHSPAAWKWIMGLMSSHAAMAAPLQAATEISLGAFLVIGLFTRPAAIVAFLFLGSLWISELGTSWIWELLVPVITSLGLAVGSAGQPGALMRCWRSDAPLLRGGDERSWCEFAPIIEGSADIVLGSRFSGKSKSGALPWHQSFGNRLAATLIRIFYGVQISDLGPFRASRADVLRALALVEATYGWAVEMISKGAIAEFRIVEVPVSYHPRIGKSKISGTVMGTVGAAWFILSRIVRYYFRRRPRTQRFA